MDRFRPVAVTVAGRSAEAALAWLPIALVAAAAIVPGLRVLVLLLAAGAALPALFPGAGVARGRAAAWVAVVPVAVALVIGLVPDPRVADPGSCDDILAAPVVRRVAQAAAVLGLIAVLAPRLGGLRAIGLVPPQDRRITVLALASPLLIPIAIVVGPLLAAPFFGEVRLGLPSAAALVPAGILALANAALEETTYRGAVQRWAAPALGRSGAIVAQAVIFGSAHLGADITAGGPLIWAGVFLAGLVAGQIADRTRSLALPFAVHAAVDVPLALALTCRLA